MKLSHKRTIENKILYSEISYTLLAITIICRNDDVVEINFKKKFYMQVIFNFCEEDTIEFYGLVITGVKISSRTIHVLSGYHVEC